MDWQQNRGGEPLARISLFDRLDALVRHPKRLLAAIVALLVAAGAAVGSSAVLTSSSTNPGNAFSAPNFDVTNNGTSALFSVSSMHPGDNASGPITITNDGELPATMTLGSAVTADTAPNGGHLASALTATITDTTGGGSVQVYSGPASPMTGEPIALDGDPSAGTPNDAWTPGEARTYTVRLTFPSSSDNTFQLSTAAIRYTWTAHQ